MRLQSRGWEDVCCTIRGSVEFKFFVDKGEKVEPVSYSVWAFYNTLLFGAMLTPFCSKSITYNAFILSNFLSQRKSTGSTSFLPKIYH